MTTKMPKVERPVRERPKTDREATAAMFDAIVDAKGALTPDVIMQGADHPMKPQPDPVDHVASRLVHKAAMERIRQRVDERQLQRDIPHQFCDEPMAWMALRLAAGVERYGTPLRTHNGRDALADCAQEVMDAIAYAEQRRQELLDVHCGDTTLDTALDMLIEVAAKLSVLLWAQPFKEETDWFRDHPPALEEPKP